MFKSVRAHNADRPAEPLGPRCTKPSSPRFRPTQISSHSIPTSLSAFDQFVQKTELNPKWVPFTCPARMSQALFSSSSSSSLIVCAGGFDFVDSCQGGLLSRRDAPDFVPEGPDDRS